MDGVVADFDLAASKILGYKASADVRYPDDDWDKIKSNKRFYRDLPVCQGAMEIVRTALSLAHQKDLQVKFLTAIPRGNDMPWAFSDKMEWANHYFPGIPVFFGPYSKDKWQHCQPGDILIDDRTSNINDWRSAGGVGILHQGDVRNTINELNAYLA
jgi:5'(3')-deoxyribonucleotidase